MDITTSAARGALLPEWLPHRYDESADAIQFAHAPRELRKSVPFLTDEHLPGAAQPRVMARSDAMANVGTAGPIHFIFHSAYCCSTLLASALDRPGVASSFKEPQILNDVVGWRHRGGPPPKIGTVLDNALTLLARPFEAGEASIVKPSNIVNGLAQAMLTIRPQAGGILLYSPLRAFLASIARKGMWGRLWVRELLSRQLTDGLVNLGFEPRDHLLHTDLQAAAVGWLAQQKLFADLATRWPERVRTLDSELLVANPRDALGACGQLFGIELDPTAIEQIVADVFSRNAKDGSTFAAGQRAADQRAGETLHEEEIEKVSIWAEAVARSAGVPGTLPAPLL